jgi:hypothetical protein
LVALSAITAAARMKMRSMNEICAGYGDAELEVIADFLRRTAAAGEAAAEELGRD